MGSSVDCRVRRAPRLFEPKFPAPTLLSSNYIDRETTQKMFEAQKVELRDEAKLREDKRDRRIIKKMNQALLENQRNFMLAMLNLRNDGALNCRQASSSKNNRSSNGSDDLLNGDDLNGDDSDGSK